MLKLFTLAPFKKNKGFTLVELMVVSGIIIFMTVLVLINYRPGSQQMALTRSAHKLAQDIRKAQEMAMSAAICEPCGNIVPDGGYGIILSRENDYWKTKYRIYADINEDERFTGVPPDIIIGGEPIDLENGVFMQRIRKQSNVNPNCEKGIINFKPPDPTVNISAEGPPSSGELWIEIILALEADPSQTRTVKVNNAGLIYVE